MKVLFTMTGNWGSGSGNVIKGISDELKKRGHETKLFHASVKNKNPLEWEYLLRFPATHNGINLKTYPSIIREAGFKDIAWVLRDLSDRELQAYFSYIKQEISKRIEEYRPDIIECHHLWAIDHVVKQLGKDFIAVAHNSDQIGFKEDKRMQPLIIDSAHKAKYIFALTKDAKEEIIDLYNVNSDKVIIIPNGYDSEVFKKQEVDRDEVYQRLGLQEYQELPLITFSGKLTHVKGADILLRANRLIQKERKVLIALCGTGNIYSFSEAERKEFSLENVALLGYQPQNELSNLHNLAELSVVPSRTEGFCLSGIEAMGCGIPLVATRISGIKDYNVGELVDIENHYQLAEGILKILNMPKKEHELLKQKALSVAKQYSWKRVAETRLEYYSKIIS